MVIVVQQYIVVKTDSEDRKKKWVSPTEMRKRVKTNLSDNDIEWLEQASSDEIRKYLREQEKLPIATSAGLPYAYRVYWGGKGFKTYFPKTQIGELVLVQGRLDIYQ